MTRPINEDDPHDIVSSWKDPLARARLGAAERPDNPAGDIELDQLPPERTG